ncbi:MAG TPA: Gmad2 immunoglobulin-like domain-containing protein [Actinomycetota bacterium]|nr:Gmad2 immunoglobulin-like domain-containing protein [Actinomycetota bacterium]
MSDEERLRRLMDRARGKERSDAADWERFTHRAHRRLLMNRAAAAGLALVLVAGGAAIGTTILTNDKLTPAPVAPAGSATATAERVQEVCVDADAPNEPIDECTPFPVPEPSPFPTAATIEVWFVDGERLSASYAEINGELGHEAWKSRALDALEALAEAASLADDESTAIPEDAHALGISFEGDTAIVDLPAEFESGGGSLSMMLRVAQVVFTVTQFEEVGGVRFAIEGELRDYIGGEGIDVSKPLSRSDFEDYAPAITVESPEPAETVTSPVKIAGTANVYEANVNIRILDENGDVLNETFVTATCGTGCRGTYEKAVSFEVDHEQPGTVEVLTYSAEDGSPMFAVSVPVTLMP